MNNEATLNNSAIQQIKEESIKFSIIAQKFSGSLLSDLQRHYLTIDLEESRYIQSMELGIGEPEEPYFAKLEYIETPTINPPLQAITALQTNLFACHRPNRYNLIFTLCNNESGIHKYWGVLSRNDRKYPPKSFLSHISSFLENTLLGSSLKLYPSESAELQTNIYNPLKELKFGVAVTGIPSLKLMDNLSYPQSLDYLACGLNNKKFMYTVIAQPMSEIHVNQIIYRLRDLKAQVHIFKKIMFNKSFGSAITEGENTTKTTSKTTTKSKDFSIGVSGNLGLQFGFGGPNGNKNNWGGNIGISPAWRWGEAISHLEGKSVQEIKTFTESESKTFGTELINPHAEAVERQINQYIKRFEEANNLGCWSVGVYLLAEDLHTAEMGGTQLKALLSGEKSFFEPIRVHNLQRFLHQGKYKVSTALQNFEQPNLLLVNPETNERLNHPLGNFFNGLTTPLNTQELALLVISNTNQKTATCSGL